MRTASALIDIERKCSAVEGTSMDDACTGTKGAMKKTRVRRKTFIRLLHGDADWRVVSDV